MKLEKITNKLRKDLNVLRKYLAENGATLDDEEIKQLYYTGRKFITISAVLKRGKENE